MKRYEWLLELLVGRWQPSLGVAIARLGLGIVCPALILAYAVSCIVARQALIIARGGLTHVHGLPAVAIGLAYACVAALLYVHVCWEDHPRFAGLRDFARQALLIAIFLLLGSTIALELI